MKLCEFTGIEPLEGTFGIEVEVEANRSFDFDNFPASWYYDEDGSLKANHTAEFVLRRPAGIVQARAALSDLQGFLGNRSVPSVRTGVHIHYNCLDLTQEEIVKIVLVYLTLEPVITKYCGEDRDGNLFCLPMQDCPAMYRSLYTMFRDGTWDKLRRADIKYSALNLKTLLQHGSLEFRAFKTPRNMNDIGEYLHIVERITSYALELESVKEIPYTLSYFGYDLWVREVLGEELYKKMKYEGFDKDVKQCMRSAQMLYHVKLKPWKGRQEYFGAPVEFNALELVDIHFGEEDFDGEEDEDYDEDWLE